MRASGDTLAKVTRLQKGRLSKGNDWKRTGLAEGRCHLLLFYLSSSLRFPLASVALLLLKTANFRGTISLHAKKKATKILCIATRKIFERAGS